MREELLYFIWKFKFYKDYKIYDPDNNQIQVLNPGIQNMNSGPDFIGAQIKTKEAVWVGNVEIDIRSSDWYKHGHHLNKEFNNVVLQVVNIHDKVIYCENGREIPVLEIKVEPCIIEKYNSFLESSVFIPCANDIHLADQAKLQLWLGNVLVARLEEKSGYILDILGMLKNSWEETLYQLLARNFGFNLNAEPFEWLAKSLPLRFLAKHQSNLLHIESMLFGQAGFLNENIPDNDYYQAMKNEYEFLKTKYQFKPIEKHMWKFMRIRPSNFPTIRISQFAHLMFRSNSLFSKIITANSIDEIRLLFHVKATEFWDNHYQFDKESKFKIKSLGQESIDKILINTVIPIIFVYGGSIGDESLKEKALDFLEKIKPEKNHIIDEWEKSGVLIQSAFYSQALIQQKKKFCALAKCLDCGIGIEIMKKQFRLNVDI